MTEDAFLELRRLNETLRFEATGDGMLIIMVGEGWETSKLGMRLGAQVVAWSDELAGGGVGGPTGTVRISDSILTIPDVSWVSDDRAAQRPEDYVGTSLPVCPEFVIEILSDSDSLSYQQEKMNRWIEYGALLGWLVDPQDESIWIYRPNSDPEKVDKPEELGGESVCEGLVVNFARVWESSK
ncbi:MAG: Uma2 family endonuclease [Chloroflexi bacterium]|nr:Uma2 family endonuclease [Chloroflexota bacterium]